MQCFVLHLEGRFSLPRAFLIAKDQATMLAHSDTCRIACVVMQYCLSYTCWTSYNVKAKLERLPSCKAYQAAQGIMLGVDFLLDVGGQLQIKGQT